MAPSFPRHVTKVVVGANSCISILLPGVAANQGAVVYVSLDCRRRLEEVIEEYVPEG